MSYDGLITIDRDMCRKEGLCVRVCPKVFTQVEPGSVPEVARPEFCNDCGHCLLICPAEANANLALQNATFAACALNLGTFYTGYVVSACAHDKSIPEMLRIPKWQRVYAGMTLGHVKIGFSRWIDRNPAKIRWNDDR